jgi:hypothetical protein
VLYDADGQAVSEHVLGDGIAHVLATSTGQVWVGYFDEGIYGNYGWGRADSHEPVGAYGIVRFSPGLEPVWHYPKYTEVGPWDAVSDCYALNVDDTCTWACYYSDFPVVRIRDGTVTGWHNDIRAPAPWRWQARVSRCSAATARTVTGSPSPNSAPAAPGLPANTGSCSRTASRSPRAPG